MCGIDLEGTYVLLCTSLYPNLQPYTQFVFSSKDICFFSDKTMVMWHWKPVVEGGVHSIHACSRMYVHAIFYGLESIIHLLSTALQSVCGSVCV